MKRSQASARRIADRIRRSSKYNRKVGVSGLLTAKGHTHIQLVSKKTGRPFNF